MAVLILLGLTYGVLSLAERSKDPIRLGLEDYLEQATGADARITELSSVELTPDIAFRMKNILLRERGDAEKTLVKVEQFYISMTLWRMVLGMQDYLGFEARGVEIATGYLFPKKLTLVFAGISDPKPLELPPHFIVEGNYNNRDLLATAEMDRKLKRKAPLYHFPETIPLTFKLGALEAKGVLERTWQDVFLRDVHVERGGVTADFSVMDIGSDPLQARLNGTIDDIPFAGLWRKGETGHILEITPARSSKTLDDFIAALREDFGLDNSEEKLTIIILPPEGTNTP